MSSLPALGRRGEGWFAIQVVLLVVALAAGAAGPAWREPWRPLSTVVGTGLLLLGLGLAARGILELGGALSPLPRPAAAATLVETGIFRHVRHPIYGGLIIGALGWGLVTASPAALGMAAVIALFFRLKSMREEVWLEERFPGYAAYRSRTRRFIPWIG
jgi:protein-S-isoprenylcysteine O-methyltransferase Ste14